MAGRERPCRPLPVNAKAPLFAADPVGFKLGDVVAHVVDQVSRVGEFLAKKLSQRAAHVVADELSVRKREIGRRVHRADVRLGFGGGQGGAAELLIGQVDPVLADRSHHGVEVIVAHLVAQTPRSGMDEGGDATKRQPEATRDGLVEDVRNVSHLDEVIPASQGAELVSSASLGVRAHRVRVALQRAAGFDTFQVSIGPEAFVHRPRRAPLQHALELLVRKADVGADGTDPGGDVLVKVVDQGSLGLSSSMASGVRKRRTPQLMSYPTPPGETTPSRSSKAATPPMGNP